MYDLSKKRQKLPKLLKIIKYNQEKIFYSAKIQKMQLNQLTDEEKKIIIDKGTERPFTGQYRDYDQQGTYLCRRCNTPLYRSADKFKSDCGRPSFDDAIPGAVRWSLDADGQRTEITCKRCGGHLGHVFVGEQSTDKNTRYCVNSASLLFVPEIVSQPVYELVTLGGGCFWCLEASFQMIKGIKEVRSGYSGGQRKFPNYEQVSSGATGHIEVVQITFDPAVISYDLILDIFFAIHNPTTLDRQWNDVGSQYRSVIFYHTDFQKSIAEQKIKSLSEQQIWWTDPIVTEIRPLEAFWIAEDYHQHYFEKNPTAAYCQFIINPKLKKLKEKFAHLLA